MCRHSLAALMVGICVCTLAWPVHGQERASLEDGALPDFSGVWGHTRLELEPPFSGAGPVINSSQVPGLLAGDYSNPMLRPWAADVVKHRYYLGMTVKETADVLGVSPRTVDSEWQLAKAWLRREIMRTEGPLPTDPVE